MTPPEQDRDSALAKAALDRTWVTPEQVTQALAVRVSGSGSLGEILLARGHLSAHQLAILLEEGRRSSRKYDVQGEIARGGMGRILRAVDSSIGRDVAVKVILHGADERSCARFPEEARLTASNPRVWFWE